MAEAVSSKPNSVHGGFRASGIVRRSGSKTLVDTLSHMPSLKKRPELFRSVSIVQVLGRFGTIFRPTSTDHLTLEGADALFKSADETSIVDFFISHCWSASWSLKYFALLYHTNVQTALISSLATWVISVALLLYRHDWDIGGLSVDPRETVLLIILVFPVAVFFLVFFFGHVVVRPGQKYWLDKLCIHQRTTELKVAGATAIPEIVANSGQLLILWDDTYFERLWCCTEIAVASATYHDIVIQPLWFTPLMLVAMLLELVTGCLCSEIFGLVENVGAFLEATLGTDHPLLPFLSLTAQLALVYGASYLPCCLATYYSFKTKMEHHERMSSHLASFQLSSAKVTVESDRVLLVGLISKLFEGDETLGQEPGAAPMTALDRFDFYVQNNLRESCEQRLGSVDYIPYRHVLLVTLPFILSSACDTLTCAGVPCEELAADQGFSSVAELQMWTVAGWLCVDFLVSPTLYPIMLRGMAWARRRFEGVPLVVVSVLITSGAYFIVGILLGPCFFLQNCVTESELRPVWRCFYLVFFALVAFLNYKIFWERAPVASSLQSSWSSSSLQSSRSTLSSGTAAEQAPLVR